MGPNTHHGAAPYPLMDGAAWLGSGSALTSRSSLAGSGRRTRRAPRQSARCRRRWRRPAVAAAWVRGHVHAP
eukprot:scaffold82459_cov32-Phaeocystis_antarctica.AAC.1